MKTILFVLALLTLFFLTNSCKDNGTSPENLEPGRRDYTWTVDTIQAPFFFANRVWGSGSEDTWAVGPGGGLDKTIWHYDGVKWETDGISRGISPLSIWGFSKSNVWLGGRESHIWHYDGNNWSENIWFKKQNWDIGFQEIWGDSPSEIYATGYADSGSVRRGIILKYNGSKWEEVNIPFLPYNFLRIKRGIKENNKYYLFGISDNPAGEDLVALFELNGNSIKKIYEQEYHPTTRVFVQEMAGKTFFVIGNKISKYVDGEFKTIIQITEPKFGLQIFGRNEKDIFIIMEDGVAHYNGSNIEYLYRFPNSPSVTDGIVFEKNVFFLRWDYSTGSNLILRGKLN